MPIFVYGSLMAGGQFAAYLEPAHPIREPGRAHARRLPDRPDLPYPACIFDESVPADVLGEIVHVDERSLPWVLHMLDEIEGTSWGLYERSQVLVEKEDGTAVHCIGYAAGMLLLEPPWWRVK